jgi:hypothetical protein
MTAPRELFHAATTNTSSSFASHFVHGWQSMAKPFVFEVEPVSRFAALDAGVRRPKVSPRSSLLLRDTHLGAGDSLLLLR